MNKSVTGAESNGTTQGAVLIASGTSALVIDGDEIDSNQQLKLQSNTGQGVAVSGGLRVNGDLVGNANITVPGAVTAANTWVKIVEYDVSGNSTGGINVTPGPYRFLKVFFQGQLTAAGVDRRILLRFNNATTNYASYEVYDGSPYGNDTENTGIYLVRTVYGIDCDFALEWTVSLDQNHRKTVFGNGMIGDSSGHYSGFVGGGWWSDTSPVNFISLSITPNAWPGWLYGHLIVYGIL